MSELVPPIEMLTRKGWQVISLDKGWALHRQDDSKVIYMHMTPFWCCLSSPLALSPNSLEIRDEIRVCRQLLLRNGQMFMTKFGLIERGSLCCTVEVPNQHNARDFLLAWALEGLARVNTLTLPLQEEAAERPEQVTRKLPDFSITQSAPEPGLHRETLMHYVRSMEFQGWFFSKSIPQKDIWLLRYHNRLYKFNVYLRTTKAWTYFEVPILENSASVLGASAQAQKVFLEYLLRLNADFFMTKLGLTTNGQVLLLLEVPTEMLDLSLFQFVARTLGIYLDRYLQEILVIASLERDQHLLTLLTLPGA